MEPKACPLAVRVYKSLFISLSRCFAVRRSRSFFSTAVQMGGGGAYSGSCCINHTCLTLKVIRVIWFSLNASGLHLFFSPMKILMGNSFWLDKSYQETSAASLYSIGNTASLHFDSRHSCRQITQKSCSPFSMTVAF